MTELQKMRETLRHLKAENRQLIDDITWMSDTDFCNVLIQLHDKDLINKLETQRVENINSMVSEMPFIEFDDLTFDTVASMYDQIYNMEG